LRGAVLHGLPDDPLSERVLWRLDTDNPYRPDLLVLTRTKPDWAHLVESSGWPAADGEHARVADYRPLLDRIHVGGTYGFRVTANPVQNTANPDKPTATQAAYTAAGGRRSFRIGHRTVETQLGWFLSRTEKWGFKIPEVHGDPPAPGMDEHEVVHADGQPMASNVRITARNRVAFGKGVKGRGKSAGSVTLHAITFEGRLEVADIERFATSLLSGIGPAKAYGCGLMTLAPLPKA